MSRVEKDARAGPLQRGVAASGARKISRAPRDDAALELGALNVLRRMREDILAGVFEPGQRLKVADLRLRYEASVGSLREALLQLVAEGLVRSDMNRGFTVAPVSLADLLDITELRVQFEIQTLADAIEHGDDAWEAEIVASMHLLGKLNTADGAGSRLPDWSARHRRFHEALVAGCRSPWLLHFRTVLFDQAERYRSLSRTYRRAKRDVNAEHQQLVDALLARDAPTACAIAERHIRSTVDNILTYVPGLKSRHEP